MLKPTQWAKRLFPKMRRKGLAPFLSSLSSVQRIAVEMWCRNVRLLTSHHGWSEHVGNAAYFIDDHQSSVDHCLIIVFPIAMAIWVVYHVICCQTSSIYCFRSYWNRARRTSAPGEPWRWWLKHVKYKVLTPNWLQACCYIVVGWL